MKKLLILVVVLLILLAVWQVNLVSAGDGIPLRCSPGTGSPGYWKNHPDAWPGDWITIGDVRYTKAEAIKIMNMPVKGDKTYTMFNALVAALLNVRIGNPRYCITEDANWLGQAVGWISTYPVGTNVRANSQAWQDSHGEQIYLVLDAYNNGYLCAPSRDALE
jgi:hypothetical protein